jgi:hypothetical protein
MDNLILLNKDPEFNIRLGREVKQFQLNLL